jgi:hypothetical protein
MVMAVRDWLLVEPLETNFIPKERSTSARVLRPRDGEASTAGITFLLRGTVHVRKPASAHYKNGIVEWCQLQQSHRSF